MRFISNCPSWVPTCRQRGETVWRTWNYSCRSLLALKRGAPRTSDEDRGFWAGGFGAGGLPWPGGFCATTGTSDRTGFSRSMDWENGWELSKDLCTAEIGEVLRHLLKQTYENRTVNLLESCFLFLNQDEELNGGTEKLDYSSRFAEYVKDIQQRVTQGCWETHQAKLKEFKKELLWWILPNHLWKHSRVLGEPGEDDETSQNLVT